MLTASDQKLRNSELEWYQTLAHSERKTVHSLWRFCYETRISTEYHTGSFNTTARIKTSLLLCLCGVTPLVIGTVKKAECFRFTARSSPKFTPWLDVWGRQWHAGATNRNLNRHTPIHFTVAFQIVKVGDTPMHVQTGEAKDKTYNCTVEPKTCERAKIKAKTQTKT